MVNVECYKCGVVFGMTDYYNKCRRDDHQSFYCPNGHSQAYVGESEAEKYKRLYDAEARKSLPLREQLAAEEIAHRKANEKIKRLKKRAAAGVCPCCNRTFQQLSQHMVSKHKKFMELNGVSEAKKLKGEPATSDPARLLTA